MITYLMEMPGLPNFGCMTKSTIQCEPQDKILWLTSQIVFYDVITFSLKYFYFEKA